MDSGLAISSPKAYSVTTGGNLWRSKHSTKNIYYASSCVSKASEHKRKNQIEYNVLRLQQPSLDHHYKCTGGESTYQKCNRKYVVKAVPKQPFDLEPHASNLKNILYSVKKLLAAFYYFSYPYTMIGITLCAFSSSLLAVEKLSDISLSFFIGVLQAVLPQLFIEIYLSGVNQLYDLEIDKINKPHLPIASGQFSFKTGVIVSASFLALSVGFTWITGSWPLIWNLIVISSTWTAYSIDNRYPVFAAMCMVSTWTFALPISFFHHMQDIPDVEGDKEHGINSLSVRLGQKRVFWICVFLFEMAFGVGLLAGASSSYLHTKIVTGLGNVVPCSILLVPKPVPRI
uniref:Uncharacterized protein n=1 Tax=Glycine max TaxID=3847 RepID=A0A0R0J086_SOYBN